MRINGTDSAAATTAPEGREDTALKNACKDFESLLVAQLLRSMRKTVQESDLFGSREKEEVFWEMLDNEIARGVSGSGGFGLAKLLYSQLSRRTGAKDQPEKVEK